MEATKESASTIFKDIKPHLKWLLDHVSVNNSEVPDWIIELVRDCSPDDISDNFSQFGVAAYLLTKYKTMDYHKLNDDKVKDECSLYVFKLFFLFATEMLRRQNIIEYDTFPFFHVDYAQKKVITVYQSFDNKNRHIPQKMSYNDFIGAFWA